MNGPHHPDRRNPANNNSNGSAVLSVERALDMLEAFRASGRPLSLTELADCTGMPKSSCHAIISTLMNRGYLYAPTRPRLLYPTRRLLDISHSIQQHDPVVERVLPLLQRLRDSARETVLLGKRHGDAVVCLQVLLGPDVASYPILAGDFVALHCSALGKALLGTLKEGELRRQLTTLRLPAVTAHTLSDPALLAEEVLEGRRRGYHASRAESVDGIWAVANVFGSGPDALAIALAGTRERIEPQMKELAQQIVAACSQAARQQEP